MAPRDCERPPPPWAVAAGAVHAAGRKEVCRGGVAKAAGADGDSGGDAATFAGSRRGRPSAFERGSMSVDVGRRL